MLVLARLEQRLDAEELCVEMTLPDDIVPDALDLQIDDAHLELKTDALAVRKITFPQPIRSDEASSKLIRKRRESMIMLSLRAPLAILDTHDPWHVRIPIGGLGRGTAHLQMAALPMALDGTPCYALVSRSGDWASCSGGYTWCHTFVASSTNMLHILFECTAWVWECPDACITCGVLSEGMARPEIEAGCEQVGVELRIETADPSASATRLFAAFAPEESRLPSAALRRGCRLYDASFAPIDGHYLSNDYTKAKPPPPTWPRAHADGGLVVDKYYASLTYGEAEFVPMYELLNAVGVSAGSRIGTLCI